MNLLSEPLRRRWGQRSLEARAVILLTVLVAVVAIGAGGIMSMLDLQRAAVDQAAADRDLLVGVERLDSALQSQDVAAKAYLRTGDPSFLDSADEFSVQAHAVRAAINGHSLNSIDQRWADFTAWQQGARAQVVAGRMAPSAAASDGGDVLFELLMGAVQSEVARLQTAEAAAAASARTQQDRLRLTTIGVSSLGVALLLLISWAFLSSTLVPIKRLAEAARALAAGDAVVIPDAGAGGEVGQLARALVEWDLASSERLTLAQAMVEVGSETDLEKVLAGGSQRLRELFAAAAVMINVRAPDGVGSTRLFLASKGWSAQEIALDPDGPLDRAAASRASVVSDLSADGWPETLRRLASAEDLGPLLAIPLISAGELVGTVSVARRSARAMFTVAEVARAELMVQPLAVAIRVATLFAQLRRANSDLALASRHKSEFLATMSHELRTPLNSILGFSQLLESAEFGLLSERQRRYVDHIHSSGDHLLALINDVLDLSKVEAGQLEIAIERVNVEEAVDQCVTRMRPQLDARRLSLHCSGLEQVAVKADARRLQQVLLNLLSNAVKFTPEGGQVSVTASIDGGEVLISVIDTGVGIADHDLQRVFEQFIQLRSGRTRSQEGTGLGLALSRRLLELMEGSIDVQSEVGKGSRFTMRLPLAHTVYRTPATISVLRLPVTSTAPKL